MTLVCPNCDTERLSSRRPVSRHFTGVARAARRRGGENLFCLSPLPEIWNTALECRPASESSLSHRSLPRCLRPGPEKTIFRAQGGARLSSRIQKKTRVARQIMAGLRWPSSVGGDGRNGPDAAGRQQSGGRRKSATATSFGSVAQGSQRPPLRQCWCDHYRLRVA